MPRERNLQSIHHPNEKQGTMVAYDQATGGNKVIPPGTTGQVLMATTGSIPTFQTLNQDVVASFKVTTFTGDGTFTTDANCLFAVVRGCGGGGGGGGAESTGAADKVAGGGGGGAGSVEEWFTAAQLGATVTVTIGAAGAASNNTGGNGGNGGNTTFGALFTANGGSGGTGSGTDSTAVGGRAGGRGGTGSSGTFFTPGTDGRNSYANQDGNWVGGLGGNSKFGQGGAGGVGDAAGSSGTGFGAGGGGAAEDDAGGNTGAAGTAGFVVVVEFLKS